MNTQSEEQKQFLLVCVEKPIELAAGHGAKQWHDFSNRLAGKPEIAAASALSFENLWLFPEENGWPQIEQMKSAAAAYQLSLRVYRIRGMPELV